MYKYTKGKTESGWNFLFKKTRNKQVPQVQGERRLPTGESGPAKHTGKISSYLLTQRSNAVAASCFTC